MDVVVVVTSDVTITSTAVFYSNFGQNTFCVLCAFVPEEENFW